MKKIIVLIGISLSLSGCYFAAGIAAGAAAVAIVYDHRTIAKTFQDTVISNKIVKKIRTQPELREQSHIEVTVYDHVALLTGETPKSVWRERAYEIAKSVPDVTRVYNQIRIQGPTSTLTRTSDSWITTKIKSQMLATSELKSGNIKVVTESGIVYLMGSVTQDQAEIAIDIARQVVGVQKVIKIFQYKN